MKAAVLLLVVLAAPAQAEHVVTVGGFMNSTLASFGSSAAIGPSLGWQWTHRSMMGVGAGLRASTPTSVAPIPLEGYVRGFFTVEVGPWAPLLGPEFGVSGLNGLAAPRALRPTDLANAERAVTGAFYVAVHTELLRFWFGRISLSALGFDVGTSLTAAGAVLRVQLDLLSVGVRW